MSCMGLGTAGSAGILPGIRGTRGGVARLFAAAALLASACAPEGSATAPAGSVAVPERVVVLGPSSAETLFALGLGATVVGVSDYCVAPQAAGLPRLGGQLNPDLERIAALDPDLVITQGEFPELERFLRGLGIDYLPLKTDSWASFEAEAAVIGRTFGVEDDAAALVAEIAAELQALRADSRGAGRDGIPALLVVGRRPGEAAGLLVAGGASFLNEMLHAAGGRNVFADNDGNYFDLSEEALIKAAPEVIFELRPGEPDTEGVLLEAWRRSFPRLPAVRSGRVHLLRQDYVLLPGPRMPLTARLFAELLSG